MNFEKPGKKNNLSLKEKQNGPVNRTRNKAFMVRLTADELEKINKKIARTKLSKTDFLISLSDKIQVLQIKNYDRLIVEMQKQGVNVNTCAKKINSIIFDVSFYEKLPEDVKDDLKQAAKNIEDIKNNILILRSELERIEAELEKSGCIIVKIPSEKSKKDTTENIKEGEKNALD